MSLLNLSVFEDRALVAVDVLGGSASRNHKPEKFTKLLPLTHSDVILCGRGFYALTGTLAALALGQPDVDFDAIASDHRDNVLDVWSKLAAARAGNEPVPGFMRKSDVAVVGWSESRGRMACSWAVLELSEGAEVVRCTVDEPPCRLAPGEAFSETPACPSTDSQMLELAKTQVAWWSRKMPELPMGGEIVIAELRRGSLLVKRHQC